MPAPGMVVVRSRSGQFIIYGNPPQAQPFSQSTDTISTNLVWLEPALVAVSCERIKQALLNELGAPDRWHGKFYLVLHADVPPDKPIQVTSSRLANGWLYRVDTPQVLEPDRFVRTIVRLVLVEWINRFNLGEMVDAPAWLSEGLAELVLEHSALDLLVPPPKPRPFNLRVSTTVRLGWLTNHMVKAHQFLRSREPLELDALLCPTQSVLLGEAALTFRYSAELLVAELFQLPNGRAAVCRFLDELALDTNQQSALLRAFTPCFHTYADMTKWWELKTYHFITRELRTQTWPLKDALDKLNDILRVSMLTRSDTNVPVARTNITIQLLLRDNWGQPWLKNTLHIKIAQLQAVQLRVPQQLVGLVTEYQRVLLNLVAHMPRAQRRVAPQSTANPVVEQAVLQLNKLDSRRLALQQTILDQENAARAAELQGRQVRN